MKAPKFTDSERFKAPYVPANATDIRKTFARARKQQAEAAKVSVVVPIAKRRGGQ